MSDGMLFGDVDPPRKARKNSLTVRQRELLWVVKAAGETGVTVSDDTKKDLHKLWLEDAVDRKTRGYKYVYTYRKPR